MTKVGAMKFYTLNADMYSVAAKFAAEGSTSATMANTHLLCCLRDACLRLREDYEKEIKSSI